MTTMAKKKTATKKRNEYGYWNTVLSDLKLGKTFKAKSYQEARVLYMKAYTQGKKIKINKATSGFICTRVRG